MRIEVLNDADSVAHKAAAIIAADAREAVVERGRFVFAVSGGKTPWLMLRILAGEDVPWDKVHLAQVDERVAPATHPDRNFTHLRESLLTRVPSRAEQVHAMSVESSNLEAAADSYSHTLNDIPFVLLGGMNGMKMGRSLKLKGVPHNRLLLSLAHGFGHELTRFGNVDHCKDGPLSLA